MWEHKFNKIVFDACVYIEEQLNVGRFDEHVIFLKDLHKT
jgi:hypothetical protein